VSEFLDLMKTRIQTDENKNYFPFSAFLLDTRHPIETLERFAVEAGQNVRRLKFHPSNIDAFLRSGSRNEPEVAQKTVLLLSRTPDLVEIDVLTREPIHIDNDDLAVLPNSFPRLRIISLDSWHSLK